MTQAPAGLGNVLVHGRAYDRVREPQRRARLEHADPGQPVRGRRGVRHARPGQRRGVPQLRPVPQHRGRPRQLTRRRPEPRDPQRHGPRDRPGTQCGHLGGGLLVGPDPVRAELLDQLPQQIRVTAGHRVARGGEPVCGRGPELLGQQRPYAARAERSQRDHAAGGDLLEPGQTVRAVLSFCRPPRKRQGNGQSGQPVGQVEQEPKGRLVGPVQVIHGQQNRSRPAGVHRQPVQAVHHRERRLGPRLRRSGVSLVSKILQRDQRPPGHSGQHGLPFRLPAEQRLEQLPRHAEGKAAFQLPAPAGQHPRSRLVRALPGRGQQRGLADPRRPGDQQHATATGPRRG